MAIIVSFILAYIMSGIYYVITDLGTSDLDRPGWVHSPTIRATFLVALMWAIRPYLEQFHLHGQWPRGIALGTVNLVFEYLGSVFVFWGVITYTPVLWDNPIFLAACVLVVFCIGVFVLPTIMAIVMLPVTGLLSLPLNLIFPLKMESRRNNGR